MKASWCKPFALVCERCSRPQFRSLAAVCGYLLSLRRSNALGLRGLLRDHEILDLGVGRLWNDLFRKQLVLLRVGAALDDLLGVGIADAGQLLELILGRRVQ